MKTYLERKRKQHWNSETMVVMLLFFHQIMEDGRAQMIPITCLLATCYYIFIFEFSTQYLPIFPSLFITDLLVANFYLIPLEYKIHDSKHLTSLFYSACILKWLENNWSYLSMNEGITSRQQN